MKRYVQILFALVILTLSAAQTMRAQPPVAILVGPNVVVSQDIDAPHHEDNVAVDGANPMRILGAVTTVAGTGEDMYDRTWASFDGGYSWTVATPPGEAHRGGGDPQVAYGVTGTAYFATLLYDHQLNFYRSTDGGLTWTGPHFLGRQDHEQITVDWTRSNHRGRIYISGENPYHPDASNSDNMLQLWRSDDDGKSFSGPHIWSASRIGALPGFAGTMVSADGLNVFTDGMVVAGVVRYTLPNYKGPMKDAFFVATSADGGTTFGPEHTVAESHYGKDVSHRRDAVQKGDLTKSTETGPMLAIDKSNGEYRDRLYAVWGDAHVGPATKLYLTYSANRGKTWSKSIAVDTSAGKNDGVFQPALAVNTHGIVGILFYRAPAARPSSFDAFFTASLDGGKTLLRPQRISTQTSYPRSPGNLTPRADWKAQSKTDVSAWLSNVFTYHAEGGDYIGLSAGSDGIFHPLWTDSRSGTYMLYTAPVIVGRPTELSGAGPRQLLDDKVTVVFDHASCDFKASVCDVPIRLRNVSHDIIMGPLSVTFKSDENPMAKAMGFRSAPYTLLNAPNGKRGPGAVFDYTPALGTWHVLPSGALSDPVDWRFHFNDMTNLEFQMHFDIRGRIAKDH